MPRNDQYENLFSEAERAYENNEMEHAISLFKELAELGVPEACQYLGLIYKTGDGVSVDDKQSQFWYSRYIVLIRGLAERGDLNAVLTLGKLYQYGDNLRKDESKAISLFRDAAKSGLPEAQFHLATLYLHGWCGCEQNDKIYKYWLDAAVANKYPEALYTKGLDLLRDHLTHDEGVEMIKQAAVLGFWPAEDYLNRA